MSIPKAGALIAAAVTLVAVAACSSTQGTSNSIQPPAGQTSSQQPIVPASTTPAWMSSSPADLPTASSAPSVGTIGSTGFTYTDGLEVTVPTAVRFTPSQTAAGTVPGQTGVLVTVTINNNTSSTFDLSGAQVNLLAGSSGNQASQIFDSANNLGNGFSGSVPPGHKVTAQYGFSVAPTDLSQIVVNVQPGFNYDTASFQGAVS